MAKKFKSGKTAEERNAEITALHDSIGDQVNALRESGAWEAFLRFMTSFHSYSINNVLLIQAQFPEASRVAGYRAWQNLGYQVRKGERGIRILGSRETLVKDEDEDEKNDGEGKQNKRRIFFPVSVFDQSQAERIDPDTADPAEIAPRLTGDDPLGICEAVTAWLTTQGWPVERQHIQGETNGYTYRDARSQGVVIDSTISAAQAAKTALHEAAHVILHFEGDAPVAEHRGIIETEAESVAYVIAGLLGLDTSSYSIGYVAGWSQCDPELIKGTATNVLRAVRVLSSALIEDEQDTKDRAA